MSADVLDDFAGAGGWSEGARLLGLSSIGVETDDDACATAEAAGHPRVHASVHDVDPDPTDGYTASPPCPDFSTAGRGAGEAGPTGRLARWPLTRVRQTRPRWIGLEQVPGVLPIWRAIAHDLRAEGYAVWTGMVNAADYGVPQARVRAILLANRDAPVAPPTPTHAGVAGDDLFGGLQPHVTLAAALGLGAGWEYDSGQNSVLGGGVIARYVRSCDRPAGTLTTKAASQWVLRRAGERRKLTATEAATLQTFRADYPWSGNREAQLRQIGNAVPPLLAAHLIAAAAGLPAPAHVLQESA